LVLSLVVCILEISITPLEFTGPLREGRHRSPVSASNSSARSVSFSGMKQHNTSSLKEKNFTVSAL
jgi:hypothetical protein